MSARDVLSQLSPPLVPPPRAALQQLPPPAPAYKPLRAIPGGQFIAEYIALEQLWDGVIPSGRLISLTSPTGHGKTAITTMLETAMAIGYPLAGRQVEVGNVLSLVGENPDDKRMRMIATAQHLELQPEVLNSIAVIQDVFDIEMRFDEIAAAAEAMGGVHLVTVDTSAAFYLAGDENDNVAMRKHASMLRELTTLPGRPAVVVLCHPTKTAQKDSLLPRGGGAFLAEVDGNLTAWKDDAGIVTLHWAGKFRGPGFDPIRFELKPWELQGYKDSKGRPVHSVVATHLPDSRAEALDEKAASDDDILLLAMLKRPGASLRDLAMACGWMTGTGKPQSSRVEYRLKHLLDLRLVEQDRKKKWLLTTKGKDEANAVR